MGTDDEAAGEADVEGYGALDLLHVVLGEHDVEGLEVRVELLDLAPADDGEHVWDFLHDVRDGDYVRVV